jgi:hypothetical protein
MKFIDVPRASWQRAALVGFGLLIMVVDGCGAGDNVLTPPDGASTATAPGPPSDASSARSATKARKGESSRREFEKDQAEK